MPLTVHLSTVLEVQTKVEFIVESGGFDLFANGCDTVFESGSHHGGSDADVNMRFARVV